MKSRPKTRWVQVARLARPDESNANGFAESRHDNARAVLLAFKQIRKVVRVEVDDCSGIRFIASRCR
jgi:hypothetical protein